jgi:ZIP family zinc transporter/zinc and cadmium transporter
VAALAGLLLHTFFDGVAIASGFLVSGQLGVLLFVAVFLHKLPEGLTVSSLMLAGGQSPQRALGAAALLGVTTLLGVAATHAAEPLAGHGLAISAGVTVYVAASNLVPELQSRQKRRMSLGFFGGAVAFFLSRMLLSAAGVGG